MSYTEVIFEIEPPYPGSEILMAVLSEIGYDSFDQTDDGLKAYIKTSEFLNSQLLDTIKPFQSKFQINFHVSEIENRNWNEVWESAYEPVSIRREIYIRAPFHEEKSDYRYQLLIEPKMSFGTAHHETTYLMMELMLEEKLSGKVVLDMGSGTGILAILAEMLGVKHVVAIDNDQNAFENARENVRKNKCKNIDVFLGDSGLIRDQYDTILANINKNILLNDIKTYAAHLNSGGVIFFSGFYEDDLDDIREEAQRNGLAFDRSMVKNRWMAARFVKNQINQ